MMTPPIYRLLTKREKNEALKVAAEKLEAHGYAKEAAKLRELVSRKKAPPKRITGQPTAEERREEKRRAHAESTSGIRAACAARAANRCELCGMLQGSSLEMDHVLGGSGRRRERQSMETCWMLCRYCHQYKTSHPAGENWRAAFRVHCAKYGYPVPKELEVRA